MGNISITGGLDYSSMSFTQIMWQWMPRLYRLGVVDDSYINRVIHKYIEVPIKQLQTLCTTFKNLRNDTLEFALINGQTLAFEAYLRDTYGSQLIQVVNNPNSGLYSYLFNKANQNGIVGYEQEWYNNIEGLTETIYYNEVQIAQKYDVVVLLPSAYATSVTEIYNLVGYHVPIGTTYSVILA